MEDVLKDLVDLAELDERGRQALHTVLARGHLLGGGDPLVEAHARADDVELAAVDHLLGDLLGDGAEAHHRLAK